MALTPKDDLIIARARKHGIVNPAIAYEEWKRARRPKVFDFATLCAVLIEETSGGINEFGHDPTIYIGAGKVTKAKYLGYRKLRDERHKCQGVGPGQLTYYAFQDQADRLGGCWVVRFNIRVMVKILCANVAKYGLWAGIAAYNGSGPAAHAYANRVMSIRGTWLHFLLGAAFDPNELTQEYVPDSEDLAGFEAVVEDQAAAVKADPLWLPH